MGLPQDHVGVNLTAGGPESNLMVSDELEPDRAAK